jgi:hypothetical protein
MKRSVTDNPIIAEESSHQESGANELIMSNLFCMISLVSSGENLNSGCPVWATTMSSSFPSCGRRLGESVCGCFMARLLRQGWWKSGQRRRELWIVHRGGGLGIHGGQMLHEAEHLLAWLG